MTLNLLPDPKTREGITVVPSKLDDAQHLVLRDGDAAEIAALGVPQHAAIRRSLAHSLWAETYWVDGAPAAIVGLAFSTFAGGHGVPWLLTGPACERHKLYFLGESRRQLARMAATVLPLVTYVHADYRRAVRWLARLGFAIEPPSRLGNGLFHRCTRTS